jgi:lysophospholipase L1-like esterase
MNGIKQDKKMKAFLFKFSANSLLVLVSLTLAFLFLEIAARFIIKAWPFEPPPVILSHLAEKDRTLRWRFSPGKGINSLGLRNKDISSKDRNTYRILYLGDSLVWSGDTSTGKLYTEVIESNLNNLLDSSTKVEVINAGIPGYTTYQELEFLKIYGLAMEPEMVILGFVFNDLFYKYLSKPTKKSILGREPKIQLHRFDVDKFPGKLFSRSYVAHRAFYALEILYKKISGKHHFPFEYRTDIYLAWKEFGWRNTKILLMEMKSLLEARNIEFCLVIYPVSDQTDLGYLEIDRDYVLYPQKMIKSICQDFQINFLYLTKHLEGEGGRSFFKDYFHMNKQGNDIVAREVTKLLITDYFSKKERFHRNN